MTTTQAAGEAVDTGRRLDLARCQALVAIGGDGTLHELLQVRCLLSAAAYGAQGHSQLCMTHTHTHSVAHTHTHTQCPSPAEFSL